MSVSIARSSPSHPGRLDLEEGMLPDPGNGFLGPRLSMGRSRLPLGQVGQDGIPASWIPCELGGQSEVPMLTSRWRSPTDGDYKECLTINRERSIKDE